MSHSAIAFVLSQFISFYLLWLTVVHLLVWKMLNQGQILQSDEQILVVFLFPSQFSSGLDEYQDHCPDSKSGLQQCQYLHLIETFMVFYCLFFFLLLPYHKSYSVLFLTQFHSNFSLGILLVISIFRTSL